MMPQVPNTSGLLVSVPEVALLEIWIQMSGFGLYHAVACLTEGRFQKRLF
jgi:ABC-type proline/glycine betaine transport system permease subunit